MAQIRVLDPGHKYILDTLDGSLEQILTFVKREGPGYPGNVGHYPGTVIQHVIRAILLRLQYVDNQIHHETNTEEICYLRKILLLLEERAAERHELQSVLFIVAGVHSGEFAAQYEAVELIPYCKDCGHVVCHHGVHKRQHFKQTLKEMQCKNTKKISSTHGKRSQTR